MQGETDYEEFQTLPDEHSLVQTESIESRKPNQVEVLIENELRIRAIEPLLKELGRACENLTLVGPDTRDIFAKEMHAIDVVSCSSVADSEDWLNVGAHEVTVSDLQLYADGPESLWTVLLEPVRYFDFVEFQPVKVKAGEYGAERFCIEAGFEALGRTAEGWLTVSANGELEFCKEDSIWKISKWGFDEFNVAETSQRLFQESAAEMFAPRDYDELRRSVHFELLVDAISRDGRFKKPLYQNYFPRGGSAGRHPSIAITDIDRDGWDDLFVIEQWRPSMLFRNRGDGTFENATKRYGLDIPGLGTSGIFADLDNDGDDDLFLGRSFETSMYLENIDGKFVDKTVERFGAKLPFLATSVSVADYNNDGLLDIYMATYGLPMTPPKKWAGRFLTAEQKYKYINLVNADDYQRFVNAAGPPNVLYENRGDKFAVSPLNSSVEIWANSSQGTWSDFDNDGDQDLYVANDFASDRLFRNESGNGFTDVTVGEQTMAGFGTGAAWGDYDQNGTLDLYVSNMYSDAGVRITKHFDQLDQRFQSSTDGNRLYSNSDARLVSANNGEGSSVLDAGWSWGGQFADFNNDGLLDLYVCSGYFTAPQRYATNVDIGSEFWRSVVRTKGGIEENVVRAGNWKDKGVRGNPMNTLDVQVEGGERKIRVHSFGGNERNKLFMNSAGQEFKNVSTYSGADSHADSRCFALWDYDHDGATDIALINSNAPHFEVFHNEHQERTEQESGFVVVRLVGGNSKPQASQSWSNRNGVGARITVKSGARVLVREVCCGEGFSNQNSAQKVIGIGAASQADSVTVVWPSGRSQTIENVATSQRITFFENAEETADESGYQIEDYLPAKQGEVSSRQSVGLFNFSVPKEARQARIRVLIGMATSCQTCVSKLQEIKKLVDAIDDPAVAFIGVPVDSNDTSENLNKYVQKHDPAYVILDDLGSVYRNGLTGHLKQQLGSDALPNTVITDERGNPLHTQSGLPTVSEIRRWVESTR